MSFYEFLQNRHARDYHGTDDDMPDAFDTWLTDLQADDWITLGELFGACTKVEILKECINLKK